MAKDGKVHVNMEGGEQHTIEVRPFTILCHPGSVNVASVTPVAADDPPIAEIGPEDTLHAVATMSAATYAWWCTIPWVREEWARIVGSEGKDDVMLPIDIEGMRSSSLAARHVFGLLTRVAEVAVSGARPFIRFPESFLHPSQQVAVAQFLLRLACPANEEQPRNEAP
jgi:hypothetical protein